MSFAQMFGGAQHDINFAVDGGANDRILPMPEPDDSLKVIFEKLRDLADGFMAAQNVAVHTGYKAPQATRDSTDLARQAMTLQEATQYDAFTL